jgi:hypothetical protein
VIFSTRKSKRDTVHASARAKFRLYRKPGDAESQFRAEQSSGVGEESYCSEAHEPSRAEELKTLSALAKARWAAANKAGAKSL